MEIKSIAKIVNNTIYTINEQEAERIINKFDTKDYTCEEKGLFISDKVDPGSKKWVAIDNTSGDCFVEEFEIYDDAIIWLLGLKEAEPLQAAEKTSFWY